MSTVYEEITNRVVIGFLMNGTDEQIVNACRGPVQRYLEERGVDIQRVEKLTK